MEIELEKLPKSRVKLTIKVSPIEMGNYFRRAFSELSSSLHLPGFRKGMVPFSLAKQAISNEKIKERVLEIALPLTYFNALKEKNLVPLHGPKVKILEFEEDKPLIYQAEVDVMPKVKLCDYKNIKIKTTKFREETQEKEIDEALKRIQKQLAVLKSVARPAKKGDFLEIDFESFYKPNHPIPGGKSQNHPVVLGEGQFILEFEEKLIGMKKGEEKEFSICFSKNHHKKELADKEILFKVRVNEVKEVILPNLDDQLAKKLGKNNLHELRKWVKEAIKKEKEEKYQQSLEGEMLNKILSQSEVEIPESLVIAETSRLYHDMVHQIESKGLKFDDWIKQIKKTPESLIADLRKQAEVNVKLSLVLEAVKEKEKIQITEEEVEKEIKKLKEQNIEINQEEKERIRNILGIRQTVDRLKKIILKE